MNRQCGERDLLGLYPRRGSVEEERVEDDALERIIHAPTNRLRQLELTQRAWQFFQPRDKAQREAAPGPLVTMRGRGKREPGVRVVLNHTLEKWDGHLRRFVDEDHVEAFV